ncbi:MAG: hypothetical protein KC466_06665, partial [Myxococcales bacterium]|nr:hypothetical protein [Myxococcales bacterium]
ALGATGGDGDGAPIELSWDRVGGPGDPPNLEVAGLKVSAEASEEGRRETLIEARVVNYGDDAVSGLPIKLRVEGGEDLLGFLDVAGGGSATKAFSLPVTDDGPILGTVTIDASRVADALGLDDRRWFAHDPGSRLRALIVDGDPRPNIYDQETFYLERALNPLRNPDSVIEPHVVGEGGFDTERLEDYDVVVLANLARPRRVEELERFVRAGGGLLVTAGENVDPDGYNQSLGRLLPRPLHVARSFGSRGDPGAREDAEHIGAIDPRSPLDTLFAGIHREQLFAIPFYRIVLTDAAGKIPVSVPLALRGGAPLLLERTLGSGKMAFFATSIDRDWCDLPIRSSFVPLVHEIVRGLARRTNAQMLASTAIGAAAMLDVDEESSRVRVKAPGGGIVEMEPRNARFVFPAVETPGQYRWQRLPAAGEWVDGGIVTVNPSPGIGDLRRVPDETLSGAVTAGGDVAVFVSDRQATRRRPLWPALLLALVAFLGAEGLLVALPARRVA